MALQQADWQARLDRRNHIFEVTGHVTIPASLLTDERYGITKSASLQKKVPQGYNPTILILDLYVRQEQELAQPQHASPVEARFYKRLTPAEEEEYQAYTEVHVYYMGELIQQISVDKFPRRS
jgi:hypothetical protein